MTNYTKRLLMAPAGMADTVRNLCIAQAGFDAADGMFRTGLVPTGSPPGTPPTWFITDGFIDEAFVPALEDPAVLQAACAAAGVELPLPQCEAILAACVVGPGDTGWSKMAEMNLELATPATSA